MSKTERRSSFSLKDSRRSIQMRDDLSKNSRSTHKDSRQNPEKFHDKNSKVNMQMIFEVNKQYLMDKIAISEIPKPSKYSHKLPSKTPKTTYNNQFHKINSNLINQIRLQRKDNLFNQKNAVTDYKSLYGQNFSHKIPNNYSHKMMTQQSKQQKYLPSEAPAFLQTSYNTNFPGTYNPIPAQSAKMKEVNLMGGGKFKGQTTYHNVYKSHEKKKQTPIHQSNNKIFMTIIAPKQTTYGKQFSSKINSRFEKSKTFQSTPGSEDKKRATSQMTFTNKTNQKNYKSQYERSFQTIQSKKIQKQSKVNLMSYQQMKNLILNVL